MENKETKLYAAVCKNGSHLNEKINPDGSIAALQFTDEENGLNGPVNLVEIDKEDFAKVKYVRVPVERNSLSQQIKDEVVIPLAKDMADRLADYILEITEIWIEEKGIPIVKDKSKKFWNKCKKGISGIKNFNKATKNSRIPTEELQRYDSMGKNNINLSDENETFTLSKEQYASLVNQITQRLLEVAEGVKILNNAVITDDGKNQEKVEMIQGRIEQLSSEEAIRHIDFLLEDKNREILDDETLRILKSFRGGSFIGDGILIPVEKYKK